MYCTDVNLDDVADFSTLIKQGGFDHLDFGCSKGGSLDFARKRFDGIRGLGIDIVEAKVESTRTAGFDAICYNIHEIPDEKLVRFVVMSHFLEHVSALSDVKAFVRKACVVSKDFVYIQQPFFDADGYLFERGFKLFWSDWLGHPNRMTSLELYLLLRDLQVEGFPIAYSIHAYKPIVDSSDPRIHSIDSSVDQHSYVTGQHPIKGPMVKFACNIFAELICLISFPDVDHKAILKKMRYHHTFVDEQGKRVSQINN
jgi:hypothetical protein